MLGLYNVGPPLIFPTFSLARLKEVVLARLLLILVLFAACG